VTVKFIVIGSASLLETVEEVQLFVAEPSTEDVSAQLDNVIGNLDAAKTSENAQLLSALASSLQQQPTMSADVSADDDYTNGNNAAADAAAAAAQVVKIKAQKEKLMTVLSDVLNSAENLTVDEANMFIDTVSAVSGGTTGTVIMSDETRKQAVSMISSLADKVDVSQSGTVTQAIANVMVFEEPAAAARTTADSGSKAPVTMDPAVKEALVTAALGALDTFNTRILETMTPESPPVETTTPTLASKVGYFGTGNAVAQRRSRRSSKFTSVSVGGYVFHVPVEWSIPGSSTASNATPASIGFNSVSHVKSPYSWTDRDFKDAVASFSLRAGGASLPVSESEQCIEIERKRTAPATRALQTFTANDSAPVLLTFTRTAAEMRKTLNIVVEPFVSDGASAFVGLQVLVASGNANVTTTSPANMLAGGARWSSFPFPMRSMAAAVNDEDQNVLDRSYVIQIIPAHLAAGACHDPSSVTSGTSASTEETNYTILVRAPNASRGVDFSVRIMHAECLYLDELNDVWKHDNCSVSAFSTAGNLRCQCNHLTTFGGTDGESVLVKPNLVEVRVINADDIAGNPVVFVPIILIWLAFLAFLYHSWLVDKHAKLAEGPIACHGNSGMHRGRFQITVTTGVRFNAGLGPETRVFITLTGSSGRTSEIELGHEWRPIFGRGSTDTFIVTTPTDIGYITNVKLRHDGNGESPPCWFVSHVMVVNLNSGLSSLRYFWIDRWLAYNLGDGAIEIDVDGLTPAESDTLARSFSIRLANAVADNHTVVSVFLSPPKSQFSKPARVMVCMQFVCGALFANAFFYQTDGEGLELAQSITTGFISSVLVLIPTTLTIFIFRHVRPRAKKAKVGLAHGVRMIARGIHKRRSSYDQTAPPPSRLSVVGRRDISRRSFGGEDGAPSVSGSRRLNGALPTVRGSVSAGPGGLPPPSPKMQQRSGLITDLSAAIAGGGEGGGASQSVAPDDGNAEDINMLNWSNDSTSRASNASSASSQSRSGLRAVASKSAIQLPYWCSPLAWTLSLGLCIWCSYYVLLLSFEWGVQVSWAWLCSVFASVFLLTAITDPLIIVLLALLGAVLFRGVGKAKIEASPEEVHTAVAVVSRLRETRERLIKHSAVRVPEAYLEHRRELARRDKTMNGILWSIIRFVFFYCCVCIVFLATRDPLAFNIVGAVVDTVAVGSSGVMSGNLVNGVDTKFGDITNKGAFMSWAQDSVRSMLEPKYYNGNKIDRGPDKNSVRMGGQQMFFIGSPRLRQLRVGNRSCIIPRIFADKHDVCRGNWDSDTNTDEYYEGHGNASFKKHALGDGWPFQHKSSAAIWGGDLPTYFDRTGYTQLLPVSSLAASLAVLRELSDRQWLDEATRMAALEFTLYAPSIDHIVTGVFAVEFNAGGAAFPHIQLRTHKVNRYLSNDAWFLVMSEVGLIMACIYQAYNLARLWRTKGYSGFNVGVNWFNSLLVASVFVGFALHIYRFVKVGMINDEYKASGNTTVYFGGWVGSFGTLDLIAEFVNAVIVALATTKFVLLFRHNTKVKRLLVLFELAFTHAAGILLQLAIVFFAYALAGHVAFGPFLEEFSSVSNACRTLFAAKLGVFAFYTWMQVNTIYVPLYFLSFMMISVFLLLNMFVAILNDCYQESRAQHLESDLDMFVYLLVRLRLLLGWGDNREMPKTTATRASVNVSDALSDLDSKFAKFVAQLQSLAPNKDRGKKRKLLRARKRAARNDRAIVLSEGSEDAPWARLRVRRDTIDQILGIFDRHEKGTDSDPTPEGRAEPSIKEMDSALDDIMEDNLFSSTIPGPDAVTTEKGRLDHINIGLQINKAIKSKRTLFSRVLYDVETAFEAFDRNNSGEINKTELQAAFKRLGLGLTAEQSNEVFAAIDADGSGGISCGEFKAFVVTSKSLHALRH